MDLITNRMLQSKDKESDSVSGPRAAKVTSARTWAGEGNEAEALSLGRGRERRIQSKSRQVFFSDSVF